MLAILLLVHSLSASFSHFVVISNPGKIDCVREFFPANETIAFHASINKKLTAEYYSAIYDESVVISELFFTQLNVTFMDSAGRVLGQHSALSSDVFTHYTAEQDLIAICVSNNSTTTILVEFNVTMSVLNNDQAKIADKENLHQYEEDLQKIEELTMLMTSENNMILSKSRQRFNFSEGMLYLASKFSVIAVFFVLVVKLMEVVYLKNKLREKKIV